MATWANFVKLVTESVGARNVVGGTGENHVWMVATLEAEKRRQKLRFEYDGKDVNWIAVTSFIGKVREDEDFHGFLELLGEDWKRSGAVVIEGHIGLRHHISLIGDEGGTDANERVLLDAFRGAARVASMADFWEKIGAEGADVM
ncbi:hypothetical protein AB0F25_05145 [Streptomyces wedmorensis]|uniref:hypothetical protein n=1 Tax=Streptomyces wedmorensis TaxID=43759 RepID=UPI00342C1B38